MRNSFIIRQDLTFREFASSTLYYYFSGRLLKRFFLFLTGLALLSVFLGFASASNGIDLVTIISSFAPIIILLIAVTAFAFFICLYIYKSKPYLFEGVSYDFTHWGVERLGERTEFSKPWRDITEFKETKAFFLLYVGNNDFHIIQKRMFANPEELNDFRKLLKANIKD
ncbi:YcxB family protein [Paraflavisolibacter sp. H34]|uniref:YcxB family protein n=1 Tax=Huijunlia imazamoxiresistens TaxID=3127457 RepID=UPI003019F639